MPRVRAGWGGKHKSCHPSDQRAAVGDPERRGVGEKPQEGATRSPRGGTATRCSPDTFHRREAEWRVAETRLRAKEGDFPVCSEV